ncbi:transmembrane protease serine 9-like [Planococcus citri]|uniref:transmembrane protease serine 9-like n=1 Tax=Planococcus citri TaxID=170843 RepID=UPI0031F80BC0
MTGSFKITNEKCLYLVLLNLCLQLIAVHSSTTFNLKLEDHEKIVQKRAINDFCAIPPPTPDKTVTFSCNGSNSSSCNINGFVPEFTVAILKCNPNHFALRKTKLQSICREKKWVPPIDKCYKKCDKLNPINVKLECYRDNLQISCDENYLFAESRVRSTCKPFYTHVSSNETQQEIFCQDDGKWDRVLLSCVPVCGRPFPNVTTLISKGEENKFGDSPWHVAVYNREKVLICGATIVSSRLVLSAAHCFHDQNDIKREVINYEIVVSKVSRNYYQADNQNQKYFKIREIRFSSKGYIGVNNYFAADIAILILQQELTISPTVMPACVHWKRTTSPFENTPGKVAGWGMLENGKLSEKLMTTTLPYISRERCLNIVPNDFQAFITFDKFCAGTEDGPGVLQGDSGGGLLFLEGNAYYIRGIVSLKQRTATAIATFTDIADHVDWILSVLKEVEPGIIPYEPTKLFPKKTGKCKKLNPINVDLHCYYQGMSVDCNGPMEIGTKVRATCKTLHTYQNSAPTYEEITCRDDARWDNELFSCVPDCGRPFTNFMTLIAYGEEEKYGDSPWNVAIYNVKRDYYLICGGTIVSPNLILSAAQCFYDKYTKTISDARDYEVVVSKVTRDYYTKDNENQKSYKIKEIRVTSKFLGLVNNFTSDIAVLILAEKLTMSPTVMPACVDWTGAKKIPPIEGTPGKTVGWGMDENGEFGETLRVAYLSFISYRQCLNSVSVIFKPFITSDKFCAGSEKGPGILRGDTGGGLLFQEDNRFFIRGIQSIKESTALPPYIASFTDLNEYVYWIANIRNEVEQSALKTASGLKTGTAII